MQLILCCSFELKKISLLFQSSPALTAALVAFLVFVVGVFVQSQTTIDVGRRFVNIMRINVASHFKLLIEIYIKSAILQNNRLSFRKLASHTVAVSCVSFIIAVISSEN